MKETEPLPKCPRTKDMFDKQELTEIIVHKIQTETLWDLLREEKKDEAS